MVSAFGVTDPGPVRRNNEDAFISDEQLRLFVVADGMGGHNAGEVASRLAVEAIRGFIQRTAESHDDYTGMGTTVVGLLVLDGHIVVGHVGDSRLYLAANGDLRQLTRDDSWVAKSLGDDPAVNTADHPMRNVLTNVVGAHEQTEIHIAEHELRGGETMLLCSDGLHGVLDDATICALMTTADNAEGAAKSLVAAALDRGSRDNVTSVVVRIERKR